MSQPLDFSSGARRPAPPPQTGDGRSAGPSSTGPNKKKRALIVLALLILIAGGGYVAIRVFGGDSAKPSVGSDARYCQLVSQLDQVSLNTGAASSPGTYDGPPSKVKAAVDQMGTTLPELRRVAPRTVRREQGTVIDALEQAAAGDPGGVKAPTFAQATMQIRAFVASRCSGGSGSNDG